MFTQLNVKTVVFQTIYFSMSTQFKYQTTAILNNDIIWPRDKTLSGTSTQEWTWETSQWSGTPHFPKHYWSLTVRLFTVIFRAHFGGVFPQRRGAVGLFCNPRWIGRRPDHLKMRTFPIVLLIYYSSLRDPFLSFFFTSRVPECHELHLVDEIMYCADKICQCGQILISNS